MDSRMIATEQTCLSDKRRLDRGRSGVVCTSRWTTSAERTSLHFRQNIYKYVRLLGRPYIHTCRSYVHTPRDFTNGASLAQREARALTEL